jgi:molecular chaperone DnaJ
MTICDDPFTILGVDREASLEEVKQAYRRLAMRWHPDRNPSAAAEAQFRRVHAAYTLFLDPQRMAEWQQAQADTTTLATKRATSTADDRLEVLPLTLEEAARGCRRAIDLVHSVRCAACHGNGKVRHSHLVPCPCCSGCGRVARDGGGTNRCAGCAGRGYLRETDCPDCIGSGWRSESRTLAVTVPAGLVDGERLRLARQAPLPTDRETAMAGDLYLEIRLTEHPLFELRGRDLHCQLPVSVFRLLCGGGIEVPTLAGTATLELRPHPEHPLEYRLPGLGFPGKRGAGAGDLILRLQCVYPLTVSAEDMLLLERLEGRLARELEQRAPSLAAWELQMRARRDAAGG